LDARTGALRWSRDIAADSGASTPTWGFSSSPLLSNGLATVFAGVPDGKSVISYDAHTGELSWAAPGGVHSYTSAQLVEIAGVSQILYAAETGLAALEPATGQPLWEHSWPMAGDVRVLQPAIVDGGAVLFPTGPDAQMKLLRVSASDGLWTVKEAWKANPVQLTFWDVVTHEGFGYAFSRNMLTCFDLQTGRRRWKGARRGPGQLLLLEDQAVILTLTEDGEVIAVRATPERYEELGSFSALEGKTWNHPVIAGGRLYVRNAEEMACCEWAAAY
ncbi:MAG: PQQ-binding-like beta-propeller repeat protein, partial [bacterium]|nr:PQQ-binding-like beta-propeller repeat protein [bacterium]